MAAVSKNATPQLVAFVERRMPQSPIYPEIPIPYENCLAVDIPIDFCDTVTVAYPLSTNLVTFAPIRTAW